MYKDINEVDLIGRIENYFEPTYVVGNMQFYTTDLLVTRTSGNVDRVPLCINEEQYRYLSEDIYHGKVSLHGSIVSFVNANGKLITRVRVTSSIIPKDEYIPDKNMVKISGRLANVPVVRETPSGRLITDIKILLYNHVGKTHYVPAIVWGTTACSMENAPVGTKVLIMGRFQSRKYTKKYDDGSEIEKETFEISAYRVNMYLEMDEI